MIVYKYLYTNDERVRNGVTSKDENLGQGWNSVNSETIKQKVTAYVVKGEDRSTVKCNSRYIFKDKWK